MIAILAGAVAALFLLALVIARPAMDEARRRRALRRREQEWQHQAGTSRRLRIQ